MTLSLKITVHHVRINAEVTCLKIIENILDTYAAKFNTTNGALNFPHPLFFSSVQTSLAMDRFIVFLFIRPWSGPRSALYRARKLKNLSHVSTLKVQSGYNITSNKK